MNPAVSNSFHFADFQAFSALRREAAADTPEARQAVARQFEAMFLNQLLTGMRKAAAVGDGLLDSDRMQAYQSMHDQQLALSLAEGGGIGLAESILRQLGGASATLPAGTAPEFIRRSSAPVAGKAGTEAAAVDLDGSPETFVAALRPHAERAASRLGIPADTLIAQAALETGWGRHCITGAAGTDSFNLFGIKATPDWEGRTVSVSTLEFVDGVPERRREAFRAYGGLQEGFDDYVQVVARQPRYRAALEAGSAEGYLRGLQAGGYATDPDYADKIIAILQRGLPLAHAQDLPAPADSAVDGTAAALAGGPRGVMP